MGKLGTRCRSVLEDSQEKHQEFLLNFRSPASSLHPDCGRRNAIRRAWIGGIINRFWKKRISRDLWVYSMYLAES